MKIGKLTFEACKYLTKHLFIFNNWNIKQNRFWVFLENSTLFREKKLCKINSPTINIFTVQFKNFAQYVKFDLSQFSDPHFVCRRLEVKIIILPIDGAEVFTQIFKELKRRNRADFCFCFWNNLSVLPDWKFAKRPGMSPKRPLYWPGIC